MKAWIDDEDEMVRKLAALGCVFAEPKTQDDMVWVERVGSLDTFLANTVFLRIRIQNGEKIILTAKKPKAATGDHSLVKREHEVVVDSADEARGILDMLGLQEAVRVVKARCTTEYQGMEICIDRIENLGSFIELEKIAPEEEADTIQREMVAFLAALGIPSENRVQKGYDILMLEKQMNFTGVIIEESLEDVSVLNEVKIVATEVESVTESHQTPWVKQWTLHTIEIAPEEAADVAEKISKALDGAHHWYADYKTDKEHYVIYRDKVFHITDRSDKAQYDAATAYGISIGIPAYQVDFAPHVVQWKR